MLLTRPTRFDNPFPTSSDYVDRERERGNIEEALARLDLQGNSDPLVVREFFGLSGLGKSRTLLDVRNRCADADRIYPVAEVDFETISQTAAFAGLAAPDPNAYFLAILETIAGELTIPLPVDALVAARNASSPNAFEFACQQLIDTYRALLQTALTGKPLILLLDHTEYCPLPALSALWSQFIIACFGRIQMGVFMAGRGSRIKDVCPAWVLRQPGGFGASYYLDSLFETGTHAHICKIPEGLRYETAVRAIYDLTVGHPLSNQALIQWLTKRNADPAGIDGLRLQLATQLRTEIIENRILPQVIDWVIAFIADSFVLRRFDAAFLEILNKKRVPYQSYNDWITALRKSPWYLVQESDLATPRYRIDPILRRLLHAVNIADPARRVPTLHLHQDAQVLWLANLGKNIAAQYVVRECLFHEAWIARLSNVEPSIRVSAKLGDLLNQHFAKRDTTARQALEQLIDLLPQDYELHEMIGDPKGAQLIERIKIFLAQGVLASGQPVITIDITHVAPDFYNVLSVGTEVAKQRLTVAPTHEYTFEDWRKAPDATGTPMFTDYLAIPHQNTINRYAGYPICFETSQPEVPWEMMEDDHGIFALTRPVTRIVKDAEDRRASHPRTPGGLRALVIGDPTCDLQHSRQEAIEVSRMLTAMGFSVTRWYADPNDAGAKGPCTLQDAASALSTGGFDLVHFAGHAEFDRRGLIASLYLADGKLESERLRRALNPRRAGSPFFFFSACESAVAGIIPLPGGDETNRGLGVAAIKAGARGSLGAVSRIDDEEARLFAVKFYQEMLTDHLTYAEACLRARRYLYQARPDSLAWAAWVLYCDPGESIFRIRTDA